MTLLDGAGARYLGALGRIGSSDAAEALSVALEREEDAFVRSELQLAVDFGLVDDP